jgi:hypothetical protein
MFRPTAAALLLALSPAWALAQVVPAAASGAAGKPPAHVTVIEDDGARIEESRNRGRVQSVTVRSKLGNLPAYNVQVAPAGRDPSQEKGNAGKRAWQVLSF